MAPVHHFMLADLSGSMLAVCLYPLFLVVPGYYLAWLCDLCEFRRRTAAFRGALSVCLSIALCPIATYLAERAGGVRLVWVMYGAAWLFFLVFSLREWRRARPLRVSRTGAAVVAIVLAWTAVALFSLVDLQVGARDYYPITAMDFSVRAPFIHSIATWGIPPRNPFYFPGHAEPVRYHYFWLIPCALVERAAGTLVNARQAWIGGVVWCGIGMMSLVALALRILCYQGPGNFRRRALTGVLLLGVTGLDILPAILGWILQVRGMEHAVLASMDWWNLSSQVLGFFSTALWEAHYLAGLITCITAFLLLWDGQRQPAWSARLCHAAIAGLALASAAGTSLYVTLVFGAFLVVWTLITAGKKWWPETAAYAVAGLVAAACSLPYLLSLRGPAGSGGPPFEFQVRQFSPVMVVLTSIGITGGWKSSLANLAVLPLNYFLEFGFFFAGGRIWWSWRKGLPLSRTQLATTVMLAVSLLICTFVRSSSISNNDLGWRGILVAQFVLLLWAVDILSGPDALAPPARRLLLGLLVLGAAGTVYDVAMLRFYPWLADRGVVSPLRWMAPDHHLGERNYAQREAYEWLAGNTPSTATIQFDPEVVIEEASAFLYADRQTVAGDNVDCLAGFGGDAVSCPPMLAVLNRMYPRAGQPASPGIEDACRSLPVNIFIAKDADAVWRDRQSWVWLEKPVFANEFVRLFGCEGR